MSGELVFEGAAIVVVAAMALYGSVAWRHDRVTRKATKAAIVLGSISVLSAVAVDVLTDFLVPDKPSVLGFISTVVAGLLSFVCLIALCAAIISLTVRAVRRRPADAPAAAVSTEP